MKPLNCKHPNIRYSMNELRKRAKQRLKESGLDNFPHCEHPGSQEYFDKVNNEAEELMPYVYSVIVQQPD